MKNNQNKIKKLIAELCPESVEFKELGDIAIFRRGSFPQPYGKTEWYGGENAMPFVQVFDVAENMCLLENTKKKISKLAQSKSVFVPKGTVIVTLQGSIGRVAITQYDTYVDRTLAIFNRFKYKIDKKYFAYQLKAKFEVEKESARGSTIKTITKEEFAKFKIPIPPLQIQEEIVKILDSFTELEAELEARKKQYDYYQADLLTFGADIKQMTLGEIAGYRRGSFPQPYGKREWYDGENAMPFVQVFDVGENMRLAENTKKRISKLAQPKSVFVPMGTVIVTLQGSIGRVAITQYDSYVDRTLAIFESFKIDINKKYFAYQLQKKFHLERESARGSTIKTITKEEFTKFKIPVPPLAEQERIVSILDKFDALVNDISIGLPAELKARRQQYEYYRERLLTFESSDR